jgi:4-coumarate--CoA ligase
VNRLTVYEVEARLTIPQVMLTHRNIVANTMMIKVAEGGRLKSTGGPTGEGDKLLAFLPFFHIYGKTSLMPNAST